MVPSWALRGSAKPCCGRCRTGSATTRRCWNTRTILPGCRRSAYRNQGLGRALQDAAESWLATQGARVLQVKTLAQSHPSRHYAQTRAFYERAGYIALEVFPLLWEEGLPVLLLVKNLPTVTPSVDLPAARPLLERSATAGRATVVPNLSFELRQWQPR